MTCRVDTTAENRIEELVGELRSSAGPVLWQRVEELVSSLMELYGNGLERVLYHTAATGALNDELRARLCSDEVVSSLLVLHGLHPLSTAERISSALVDLRTELDFDGDIELTRVEPDGVVWLRVHRRSPAGTGWSEPLGATLRSALERAAPEIKTIVVDDHLSASLDYLQTATRVS